jgi:multiple sugar transport system permease protein
MFFARRLGLHAIAITLGIILMLPFYWAVIGSLKQMHEVRQIPLVWWPAVPQWINYLDVWNVRFFPNWVWNSVLLTVIATTGTVLSSSLAGFAFARFRFPGRNLLSASPWPP